MAWMLLANDGGTCLDGRGSITVRILIHDACVSHKKINICIYICNYIHVSIQKSTTPVIRSSLTPFLETSVFLSIPDHLCNSWYVRRAEKLFQTVSFSHDSQTCRDPMVFSFTTHSFAARVISLFLASQSWRELNELPYLLHLIVTPVAFHLYLWYSNLPFLVSEHHPTTRPGKNRPRANHLAWQLLPFAQHGRHPQPLC